MFPAQMMAKIELPACYTQSTQLYCNVMSMHGVEYGFWSPVVFFFFFLLLAQQPKPYRNTQSNKCLPSQIIKSLKSVSHIHSNLGAQVLTHP